MASKKKKLDLSKILFIIILIITIYVTTTNLLSMRTDDLSDSQFSDEFDDGVGGSLLQGDSKLPVKEIEEEIYDEKLNLKLRLERFVPNFNVSEDEFDKRFESSDLYLLVGFFDNMNEYPYLCDVEVIVKTSTQEASYISNIVLAADTVTDFEVLIELPDGRSVIDYKYNCEPDNFE